MINIQYQSMHDKMESLSSLTNIAINIQNALQTWELFQHHLSVSTEAIVEACVQQHFFTNTSSPQQ